MRKFTHIVAAGLVVVLAFAAQADTWTDPDTGYTWTYRVNGETAEIYNNWSAAISPQPSGSLEIPSMLGGKAVMSIGQYAFRECNGLVGIIIPNTITNIGMYAFYNCTELSSVTIPNSVTNIGANAFYGCSGLTSVTIGNSVTSIGSYAFFCSGLASVTFMGDAPADTDDYAFLHVASDCTAYVNRSATGFIVDTNGKWKWLKVAYYGPEFAIDLNGVLTSVNLNGFTAVKIPDVVTSIGDDVFYDCSGLESVTIPDSVTSIGERAFYGCSGLTSVTIPNSVTNIGASAFYGCSGLTSVTIPNSVTNIGASAFHGCSGLTSMTIPGSVTSIGDCAFSGCSGLKSVTIPQCVCTAGMSSVFSSVFESITNVIISSGVTTIGANAFYGCSGLTSVTIPDSVTNIGDYAFYRCKSLENVTIPNSVTNIGERAFAFCYDLTNITIPPSVKKIGNGAFNYCGLTAVHICDLEAWCRISFDSSDCNPLFRAHKLYLNGTLVENLLIPHGITNINSYAFCGCSSLINVAIPADVMEIGREAFSQCDAITSFSVNPENPAYKSDSGLLLTKDGKTLVRAVAEVTVTIPNGVTSIGVGAFSNYDVLTNVIMPDGVMSIGDSAFYNCTGLTNVTLPDGVTSIGDLAFYNCTGLTNVTLPDGVTSIGYSAFHNCTGLTDVRIPGSVTSIGSSAFSYCGGLTNVIVSAGMTSIGLAMFNGCSELKTIAIPDSVTSIGWWAFQGCVGLTSVALPDALTSIDSEAFSGCSGLRDVTVPQCVCNGRLSSVFPAAYSSITNVVISKGVTNIVGNAFLGCNAIGQFLVDDENEAYKASNGLLLTKDGTILVVGLNGDVEVPDGVISIADGAFGNCSALNSIKMPNSLRDIGMYAFDCCAGLKSVEIPEGVTNIGYSAFSTCSSLKSVTLPESLRNIGDWAFHNCQLISVTIPRNVTDIGNRAFSSWRNSPTNVIFLGTMPKGTADSYILAKAKSVYYKKRYADSFASIVSDSVFAGYYYSGINDWVCMEDDGLADVSFSTGGNAHWNESPDISHDGFESYRSGDVSHLETSWIEMDTAYPGRLSFWWKASSESDGADIYDYAYLSVDGEAKGSLTDDYRLHDIAIGGKTDWTNVVIDVDGAGPHTICWTYCKDDFDEADTGDDCVWLDDIVWTPKVSVSYDISDASGVAPNGVAMLAGTTLTLPGAAGFSWTDHVFDGWSDGKNTYLPGETYEVPRTDVTFAAQWIRKSVLTFALNGGSGTAPMTIKEVPGTKVTLPLATGLSRAKHTFAGWSDGATTYHEGAEYVIGDQDVAFTAVWTANTLAAPIISSVDVTNGGTIETVSATIAMSAEAGTEIHYTTDGSLPTAASPRYAAPFVADGMNVTIKAIAMRDNYFDSDVATFSFTRKPYSLSECLGMDGATVTTGGDSSWGRVLGGEAYDGVAALKSGSLGDSQTNWVQMVVSGPGTISFWWKVSSEGTNRGKRRDGCVFSVDGVEARYSDGTTNVWTQVAVEVSSPGVHTLKWAYGKNDNGTWAGDDCAWLAEVVWTQGVDPSVPHWSIVYENLKGAANPNPSMYYEGYGVMFQPLSDVNGYTFAGWTPNSIPANATGDKVVTANWNWAPQDAVVESSITGGKALNVDAEWVKTELDQVFGAGRQQLFVDKFGDDFAAALAKKTGKRDGAGNELAVWHDFVAGTDPTDVNSIFKAKIEIRDGMPIIEWEPNLNSNGEKRVYTVYGKATFADDWHSPTNALDHFFKVVVTMPQDGTITFNVGGGSSVDPIVVRVGQPIGDLPTPTRQGYDFLGWFTESGGGTEITPETIVTDDMTIFAHWEKRLAADLVHRWSFNGDLTDSIGGQTATKVGNVTTGAEQYTLAGGENGSSYINLGSNVLPNDGSPVTLEIWATHFSYESYSRMFTVMTSINNSSFGGRSDEFSLCWDGDADVICRIANWHVRDIIQPYDYGVEYHISAVFTQLANGNWQVVFRKKNLVTGETLGSYTKTFLQSEWTLQIQPQTYCMLGHVNGDFGACDANASYNELRIWKKAMTEEELTASAIAGPDADL